MIKLRTFTLFVLLSVSLGITACGGGPDSPNSVVVNEEPNAALIKTPSQTTEITAAPTTRPGYFSQERLIEDTRQLADILESPHPDPYIRGGGKIAIHRRLYQLLNAIPEEGMTRDEFVHLLRPFIAAVGEDIPAFGTVID